MSLIITIDGIKEARQFREWLHKINEKGIDEVCNIVDKSIMDKGLSNSFIFSSNTFKESKTKK